MAAILRTTYSIAFSWMQTYEFRLKFDLPLLLRVQWAILKHWSAINHYLNQWWLDYRCIYMRHSASMSYHTTWWPRGKEAFPALLSLCRGSDISFVVSLNNLWTNCRFASDLRCYDAHVITDMLWIRKSQRSNMILHTVKPVYNDHLMGYFSAFWSSLGGQGPPIWAPEGRNC